MSAVWAIGLPLFSAVTVALVGVLTRKTDDRLAYIGLLNFTVALLAIPMLPFAPWPTPKAWWLLLASTVVHWIYQLNMIRTLAMGDLSLAFPIMRGLAPLLIAIVATVVLDEPQSTLAWTGLFVATLALVAFGLAGHRFRTAETHPDLFLSAIVTAMCVAAYTTIDAAGVRAMQPGEGLGFVIWFFLVGGVPAILTGLLLRRSALVVAIQTTWKPSATAGVLSFLSYGSALMAMGMVPVAHVAAIRETSVVFAALFGWLILGESFGTVRVALAAVIVGGLAILKLS